ncbi:hypothetical protein Aple_022540 [Acrocarpospora pleiomorpha]|uniref:Oxidoreductase n=1 Tax=Acrocarpospora pleiomorpha TaxID=90975 RepID=A0A5M3XMG0_9ACTN|nr:nitroreductase family protein [Acrocarpospora pleiomorpha]GES19358.1 hypothetical protein Aple_022540 [Acrocarpospora pleiomorpha]
MIEALQDLYARYALGLDGADFDLVARCFAADATYEVDGVYSARGKDAIMDRIRSRWHAGRTHLTCNTLFDREDGGVIRGRATFAVLDEHAAVLACGEYDDRVVLGPEGEWVFASRRISYRATGDDDGRGGDMDKLGLGVDEVLTTTRAVRKRLDFDRPVELGVIRECLEVALQAPSGSNKQSWHFVVVRDEQRRARVAEVYRKAFADYEASPLNSGRLFADDAERHAAQGKVFGSAAYLAQHLHRVPCLLVPVAAGRADQLTSAHRQANYWGGIIPAVWSFMLAARERGLGTSWTTMHLRYEQEVADILEIPYADYTQAALVPVAYTLGTDFRPGPRQPLDDVLHLNRW